MDKPSVLFLCTENRARSQMAEALLRHRAGDRFDVYSAGVRPAPEVHPLALQALSELGIDASSQRPQSIEDYLGKLPVHYLITVCANADKECPSIWPGMRERLAWPVDDPAATEGSEEERLAAFRVARDTLDEKIQHWLAAVEV